MSDRKVEDSFAINEHARGLLHNCWRCDEPCEDELCDTCADRDPTLWCTWCKASTADKCVCGPIPDNF